MNKAISFVAALALVGMSATANAATVSPTGANSTFMSGTLTATVFGSTLNCTGNLTLSATSSTLSVSAFTLTGAGCTAATITNLPYAVTIGTPSGGNTLLTINGMTAQTFIPGISCSGNVSGTYNNTSHNLSIPSQTLGFCTFAGTLNDASSPYLNII